MAHRRAQPTVSMRPLKVPELAAVFDIRLACTLCLLPDLFWTHREPMPVLQSNQAFTFGGIALGLEFPAVHV